MWQRPFVDGGRWCTTFSSRNSPRCADRTLAEHSRAASRFIHSLKAGRSVGSGGRVGRRQIRTATTHGWLCSPISRRRKSESARIRTRLASWSTRRCSMSSPGSRARTELCSTGGQLSAAGSSERSKRTQDPQQRRSAKDRRGAGRAHEHARIGEVRGTSAPHSSSKQRKLVVPVLHSVRVRSQASEVGAT